MIVISHRGYWLDAAEKNTPEAFARSFNLGFGTETDVRDCLGELVVSHDLPRGHEMKLESLLFLLAEKNVPLAVNIKADGLAESLSVAMKGYGRENWFVFDMSIPDMRQHLRVGNPVFARWSEVEREPAWYDKIDGLWLDSFSEQGPDLDVINKYKNKRICIVSPELHGRDHMCLWNRLLPFAHEERLMLCTDLPEIARTFFTERIQ